MVRWTRICRSKEKSGLGIKVLRKQNISLLVKWWWKLETQNGLWQTVILSERNILRDTVLPLLRLDLTILLAGKPSWKLRMFIW